MIGKHELRPERDIKVIKENKEFLKIMFQGRRILNTAGGSNEM